MTSHSTFKTSFNFTTPTKPQLSYENFNPSLKNLAWHSGLKHCALLRVSNETHTPWCATSFCLKLSEVHARKTTTVCWIAINSQQRVIYYSNLRLCLIKRIFKNNHYYLTNCTSKKVCMSTQKTYTRRLYKHSDYKWLIIHIQDSLKGDALIFLWLCRSCDSTWTKEEAYSTHTHTHGMYLLFQNKCFSFMWIIIHSIALIADVVSMMD